MYVYIYIYNSQRSLSQGKAGGFKNLCASSSLRPLASTDLYTYVYIYIYMYYNLYIYIYIYMLSLLLLSEGPLPLLPLCAALRGFARLCTALRGFARLCSALRGFTRLCTALRGLARPECPAHLHTCTPAPARRARRSPHHACALERYDPYCA